LYKKEMTKHFPIYCKTDPSKSKNLQIGVEPYRLLIEKEGKSHTPDVKKHRLFVMTSYKSQRELRSLYVDSPGSAYGELGKRLGMEISRVAENVYPKRL